uniref:Hemocyanin subunit type 2 n=1 Tax=Periplaneta americana TaxID=6978 RepID=B9W4N8_PERAM|nr:hemocyanin subunit type 2 precursor [Periplaneta americana]
MKLVWALAIALGACALVVADQKADMTFLTRQLQVLKLLRHLNQPLSDPELTAIKNSFSPLNHLNKFKEPETVKLLVGLITKGKVLQRDTVFSLFHPRHRYEMVTLFETLYGATDYDTFFRTAVYARDRLNPRQFLYAFSVALLHRQDCRGICLPPAYEITPHMFLTTDVVRKAYKAKMTRTPTVIPMKFTGSVNNPEQRVAYFGEDIGMNSHHSHWHMDFPFWWKQEYAGYKDRKGELFYYMHHQMVARFDAERLSNDLPVVEPLEWDQKIVEGFAPGATYENGQEFPMRPDNMCFSDLPFLTVQDMKIFEGRIRDAIASGYVKTVDSRLMSLNNTAGINLLGEIVESSTHSVNPVFYGKLHNDGHVMLSKVTDPHLRYGVPPGVMEHFETATRDPAFFRLHKHVDNLFKFHKDLLVPYSFHELEFPGVKIEAVKVIGTCKASTPNHLITYFDESHIDLNNIVDTSGQKEVVDIKALVGRLNHEPFKYVITVHSEKPVRAIVRVFPLPKYNWFGQMVPLDEARWGAIELDRFPVSLVHGDNIVTRNSEDSTVTIPEPRSFPDLMSDVQKAIRGEQDFKYDIHHRHCGFPHRLLLPKGKPEGMVYRLFVVVTDYDKDVVAPGMSPDDVNTLSSLGYCGVMDGKMPDGKPMGFPFDRRVPSEETFYTPNIKTIDLTIKNVKQKPTE